MAAEGLLSPGRIPATAIGTFMPRGLTQAVLFNGQQTGWPYPQQQVTRTPTIVSDGSGGAIITWQDYRNGNNDIYAQRINAGGTVQWTLNGVAICTETHSQTYPTIVSDGSGGAIITWQDDRNGNNDIYAQRIIALGINVVICHCLAIILPGDDSPSIAWLIMVVTFTWLLPAMDTATPFAVQ